MKRISYAEDHLVTGDDIADAVLAYAQALAMKGRSDSIDVPAIDRNGAPRVFSILVGPASQMLTSDSLSVDEARGDEITDEGLVADLASRTAALAGPSPVSVPQGTDAVDLETEQFGVPDLGGDAPDEDSEGAEGADDEGDSPSR
ncbi:hypothetical protein IFT77_13070 [Frigoribacterium sp. CFBP 13729]|jgi:hypothetical protein|uniref:hypothetical protein n=1 Tax=unclassified Frigoribacterium TaxID=2627005 RepID=UPI001784D039|nr:MULTISPECIES: hypothetical protein [unclassified Frigoribacterium]MBD8585807.1 hypothetical protein [Frigoribacterium sp. CFBP 8766]MBD8611416.1 hypothetical protein [Frigoribacterium sp. CFBP 13729]